MSTHVFIGRSAVDQPCRRPRRVEPRRFHLAVLIAIASATPLILPSTQAGAADMPVKAPAARTYNWGGCYIGVNGGGAASGSDFTTTVGTGTHLTTAHAALVVEGGTSSANSPNFLGGGQAGCNWVSGTFVYGLEGDVEYFRNNPQFINGTSTLSDGATTFTVTQSLTTNFFATVRPRLGVAADRNLFYITGGAAFTKASYAQSYVDAGVPVGTGLGAAQELIGAALVIAAMLVVVPYRIGHSSSRIGQTLLTRSRLAVPSSGSRVARALLPPHRDRFARAHPPEPGNGCALCWLRSLKCPGGRGFWQYVRVQTVWTERHDTAPSMHRWLLRGGSLYRRPDW
jgi:hypothetical protein